MGDYLDLASYKEQRAIKTANLHESTMSNLDELALRNVENFCEDISFMKGRTIGVLQGNHYWRFGNGETSDSIIADYLGAKWLGWFSVIKLIMSQETKRNADFSFSRAVCHGRAGGKLLGTSINQVADMGNVIEGCDVYIMGHDHQRGAFPESKLVPCFNNNTGMLEIKEKLRYYCRSGSFLKAYESGCSGYIVKRLKKPASLGSIEIHLESKRTDRKGEGDRLHKVISVTA
jgi:hypothetical protein